MSFWTPLAVYSVFSSNSNAAATQAKLDLLCQATLYPDETRAALARKRADRRAKLFLAYLLWFGIFVLVKFGLK